MTEVVKVHEAKTRLSALLAAVEAGEDVIIARGDSLVARLTAYAEPGPRAMGFVAFRVPDSFFEPLEADELALWNQ